MSCQHFREKHPACTDCNHHSIITASERKSKYILNNPQRKEVCRIQVDGCIPIEGKKCDYLILSCQTKIAFFVELKGSDLTQAIDQLDQSIEQLKGKLEGYVVNARAVLSKPDTPAIRNTHRYIKLVKKVNYLGGTFEFKNNGVFTDTLE